MLFKSRFEGRNWQAEEKRAEEAKGVPRPDPKPLDFDNIPCPDDEKQAESRHREKGACFLWVGALWAWRELGESLGRVCSASREATA